MTDPLQRLQEWFMERCNDDWEHQYGINIETLDNPGWSVEIDLQETALHGKKFEEIDLSRGESDWVKCRVRDHRFEGFGGPRNLSEVLCAFFEWLHGDTATIIEQAFDESRLTSALTALQAHQQLAFGAACCERTYPNYRAFSNEVGWGDSLPLRQALDMVWQACTGVFPETQEVRKILTACETVTPDSDDFDSIYSSSAQDAVFAVCSLLDFLLRGETSYVVNAARYPTDSIDLIVQERENLDPEDSELGRKILEHPLMQQELLRQKRDLADVKKLHQDDEEALLALKLRAEGELTFELSESRLRE